MVGALEARGLAVARVPRPPELVPRAGLEAAGGSDLVSDGVEAHGHGDSER